VYAPDSQVDRRSLRQGDILTAVVFPIIDAETVVLGKLDSQVNIEAPHPRIVVLPREHRGNSDCLTLQIKARLSSCSVVSHCCELELRHGKCFLPMISLARIIPVKESIIGDPQKINSLRANKDPRSQTDLGYIDYFWLQPAATIGRGEFLVDFSQITAIPATEYSTLLQRKTLQLEDRERVRFKIKLAAFLGRLTDEEFSAGLENPWP
jgi:hypothetical protein